MKPFSNLESQPARSEIHVENAESIATLVFPGLSNFYWILAGYAMALGLLIWQWQGVIHLVQFDGQAWGDKWIVRPVLLAALLTVGGTLFLFGHHKLDVTIDGISRYLCVFGLNIFKCKAQFNGIADITTDTYSGGPVIWVYPNGADRFNIEFPSIEERDWVAEELKRLWRNRAV